MKGKKEHTNEKKIRIGITISPHIVEKADNSIPLTYCRSRSELIEEAIEFYTGHLAGEEHCNTLSRLVDETTRGIVGLAEHRLNMIVFKLAVEMAKIMHMIAPLCEIGDEELHRLNEQCVDEVKHINGTIKLDYVLRDEV